MQQSIDRKQLRFFGLSLAAALTFWVFIYCWVATTKLLSPWPAWLVIVFLAGLALFKPELLRGVYLYWMKLAEWLNIFITTLLLGSIFFLIITPVAFIKRLLGDDALSQSSTLPDSYRIKSVQMNKRDMEHPY